MPTNLDGPRCPICGEPAEAEFVDIGVGEQQVTPWYCAPCQWTEGDDTALLTCLSALGTF